MNVPTAYPFSNTSRFSPTNALTLSTENSLIGTTLPLLGSAPTANNSLPTKLSPSRVTVAPFSSTVFLAIRFASTSISLTTLLPNLPSGTSTLYSVSVTFPSFLHASTRLRCSSRFSAAKRFASSTAIPLLSTTFCNAFVLSRSPTLSSNCSSISRTSIGSLTLCMTN